MKIDNLKNKKNPHEYETLIHTFLSYLEIKEQRGQKPYRE
jgi:hypothetical protein